MWKNFETRFRSILQSLSQHRHLIAEQAAVIHYEQSQQTSEAMLSHIRQYEQDSQAMLRNIRQYEQDRMKNIEDRERQEKSEAHRKYLEVLQWFSAADTTTSDQEHFTRQRGEYPGTGDWILKNEKIRNWQADDTPTSSILWLNGKPGAGNSLGETAKSYPKKKKNTEQTHREDRSYFGRSGRLFTKPRYLHCILLL